MKKTLLFSIITALYLSGCNTNSCDDCTDTITNENNINISINNQQSCGSCDAVKKNEQNVTYVTTCCYQTCIPEPAEEPVVEPEVIEPKATVVLEDYDCSCGTEFDSVKGWAIINIDENTISPQLIDKIIVSSGSGNVLRVTEDGVIQAGKTLMFDYLEDSVNEDGVIFNQVIHYDTRPPQLKIKLLLKNGEEVDVDTTYLHV